MSSLSSSFAVRVVSSARMLRDVASFMGLLSVILLAFF